MVNVKLETRQGDVSAMGLQFGVVENMAWTAITSHPEPTPVWISMLRHFTGPAQSIFCSDHQSEQLEPEAQVSKDDGVNA